jgi:hypothetical protein
MNRSRYPEKYPILNKVQAAIKANFLAGYTKSVNFEISGVSQAP